MKTGYIMRIDNTGRNEFLESNTAMGTKGPGAAGARAAVQPSVKTDWGSKVDEVSKGHNLSPAAVKKALFSLESEMERIKQDAGSMDLALIQTQMAVLSNTLSGEDAKHLQEEGYSLNDTQVETIVTAMDKIRLELAKGGVDAGFFGADLSMEQLEAMTGNAAQAKQLAADLTPCSDGAMAYLVDNGLEPTIENLYWAQHSGSSYCRGEDSLLAQDESFRKQIEKMIEMANLPVNETSLGYADLLLQNDIPLTTANLAYMDQLGQLTLPLEEQAVEQAISQAVVEGRAPKDAYLMAGYSFKERAQDAAQVIATAGDEELASVLAEEKAVTVEHLKQAGEQTTAVTAQEGARVAQPAPAENMSGPQPAVAENMSGLQPAAGESSQSAAVPAPALPAGAENQKGPQSVAGESRQAAANQAAASNSAPMATGEERFITARRQLEEIRLMMTVEANYQLLKKGISIETLELEQLVEELRALENDYYQSLLKQQGIEPTAEASELFRGALERTEALKGFPSYLLGTHGLDRTTLQQMYENGSSLKALLDQANEAYETMMTAPRSDLGDSIQKAFRNVDDILRDLALEPTEPNQRAVRILAYNQMEITPEEIARVKAADEKMQNLFQNMKPAVVLEMIREGISPLQIDLAALNQKAEELAARLDPGEEEKYSKYLWKLEQKQEITPEEKESYIGIYRLLRQIEKTDGAVIGAVVNQGGDLSLKNLLTAVRSRKKTMDVKVDTEFGGAQAAKREDLTIDQQIEAAYQTDCAKEAYRNLEPEYLEQSVAGGTWQEMTPEELLWQMKDQETTAETEERYYDQQLQQFESGRQAEAAVIQLLREYDQPVDTWHIQAMGQFVNNRNGMFGKLFDPDLMEESPDLEAAKEQILKEFAEAVKTPEDMAKAQMALAETAEHVMEGMINEKELSSQQVRELKLLRTQIQISGAMNREEHYAIPVLIADEMTNVQLKIVRGKKTRGMVDVFFETERLGKVAARLRVSEEHTESFVVSDREETLDLFRQQEQQLKEKFAASEEQDVQFYYQRQPEPEQVAFASGEKQSEGEKGQPEYEVQTARLYAMAKTLIETVKQTA